MESAFQHTSVTTDVIPKVFIDAVNLYYSNRNEFKRLLKYANALIGKIVLPEDTAKIEKVKQQARDALPVQKTRFIKTKTDRKLKERYPSEFIAVFNALETRYIQTTKVLLQLSSIRTQRKNTLAKQSLRY